MNKVGLNPLAVICDQASTNRNVFKSLGVTIDEPYFVVDTQKYYAIFDAPHLVKSVRNNLLDVDFVLQDNIVSFKEIQYIYQQRWMSD